jgi:hypothetical protein
MVEVTILFIVELGVILMVGTPKEVSTIHIVDK